MNQQQEPTISDLLRLSVSKSKTFNECKKKYQFSYVLKLPRKEFEYHTFGKLAHSILEHFHLAYLNGSIEMPNVVMMHSFRTACLEFQDKITPEMKRECKEIASQYLQSFVSEKERGIAPAVLGAEKEFALEVGEQVLLNGVIDKIQLDPDNTLHILDYKTTKNKKYLKDDWFQLLTYAFVIHQQDPTIQKVRASYVLLRHNLEKITKEFTLDDILPVKELYLGYAKQIVAEEKFEASPTFMCRFCEFLEFCEEGRQKVEPIITAGAIGW
jgi:ATP-dependent exoDNAse (exonuclease V) beta subunit